MPDDQEINGIVRSLCKEALDGTLKLKDFYERWPIQANAVSFFDHIREDIEDGIEHLPGYWLKGGIDYESWHGSRSFLILYLDVALLNCSNIAMSELEQNRNSIAKTESLTTKTIDEQIAGFLFPRG